MKIMLKANEKDKWQKVNEKGYARESELQEILGTSPDLIPVSELGGGRKPIKVAIREGGLPGSGTTDLIGVDEDGNITVVETKLAQNEEIKRKVIGQILEYAAYLWQKPYEEFDAIFHQKLGGHLIDLMEKAEKESEDWSSEEFRDAVEMNLKNGTFALFIVVDEINEELRRIIDYLNSKNFTDFELYALELKYFREKGVEVVLPQLYGVANRPAGRRTTKQWDENSFFQHAKILIKDEVAFNSVSELYKFSKDHADEIGWGSGSESGSFTFKVKGGKFGYFAIFTVWTNGSISFRFKNISRHLGRNVAESLFQRLSILPITKDWNKDEMLESATAQKSFLVGDVIPDQSSLSTFTLAILDFIRGLKK